MNFHKNTENRHTVHTISACKKPHKHTFTHVLGVSDVSAVAHVRAASATIVWICLVDYLRSIFIAAYKPPITN